MTGGGLAVEDAVALTAGVAGYQIDAANGWIGTLFDGATLTCPRQVGNDAVIAHRGALAGAPGVIVVAGTGSMIAAITAAVDSSPLADAAVTRVAEKTAVGVRLLAPLVSGSVVPVALAGALATSAEFAVRITRFLTASSAPRIF